MFRTAQGDDLKSEYSPSTDETAAGFGVVCVIKAVLHLVGLPS